MEKPKQRVKRSGYHTSTPHKAGRSEADRHETTLTRTKSLLLAALKVWELKNGYRD